MANFTVNWIPNSDADSTGFILSTRAKSNPLSVLQDSSGVTPINPMPPTQATAQVAGRLDNIIYTFYLDKLCNLGFPPQLTYEQINFVCTPITFEVRGDSSFYVKVDTTAPAIIDGNNQDCTRVSDIDAVEFSLYDAANTTLIQGPFISTQVTNGICNGVTLDGVITWGEWIFLGLTPGATYTVRYTLLATVNGVTVRSDDATQLTIPCDGTVELPPAPTSGNFRVSNYTDLADNNVIDDVPNYGNYYTINTGSIPVLGTTTPGVPVQAIGTHAFIKGRISVIMATGVGGANLGLYINGIGVEYLPILAGSNTIYQFSYFGFAATDDIEIKLEYPL